MKPYLGLVVLVAAGFIQANAETVTLFATLSSNSPAITLLTNETARVLHWSATSQGSLGSTTVSAGLLLTLNGIQTSIIGSATIPAGASAGMLTDSAPVITGPATIQLFATTPKSSIRTLQVTRQADLFIPSTSVVIPADAGGPVTIILESSVDLVNWIPALPGTYGTTTTNRFFRVRAQR